MEPAITSLLDPAAIGILMTGLLLGMRHGIDWDHIAAITDITSTAAAAGSAESPTATSTGRSRATTTVTAALRRCAPTTAAPAPPPAPLATMPPSRPARFVRDQVEAVRLGTLYALGHGAVVFALGLRRSGSARSCPTGWTRSWAGSWASRCVVLGMWVFFSL